MAPFIKKQQNKTRLTTAHAFFLVISFISSRSSAFRLASCLLTSRFTSFVIYLPSFTSLHLHIGNIVRLHICLHVGDPGYVWVGHLKGKCSKGVKRMSENLDREGMRKEWQALMHLFVISVRVLFNANLIKGRISVIALLQLKPRFSFWFPAQDMSSFLCAPSYTLQSPQYTHTHAHEHAHFPSERTRHWPA